MNTPTPAPSASELLACPDPWCPTNKSGEPEFGYEPLCVLQQYGGYAVECAVCGLAAPAGRTEADANAKWNTRHSAPADTGGGVDLVLAIAREGLARDAEQHAGPLTAKCYRDGTYDEGGVMLAALSVAAYAIERLSLPTTNQQHPQSNDKEG